MDSKFITDLRKRLRWTQQKLAAELRISLRKVQLLESNNASISHADAAAIMKIHDQNPTRVAERHLKLKLDFDGLISILAGHLYVKKEVFIRELLQNAHDAIWKRAYRDLQFKIDQGRIDVVTDLTTQTGRLAFRDNGVGMTEDDLVRFLAAIGRSEAREADKAEPEVIGQFGIGFLSGFVVANRIEVRTRHFTVHPEQACLWVSNGNEDYTIEPIQMDSAGTEVTIYLKDATDRGLLQEEALRRTIVTYTEMLRIPIHLNDPQHNRASVNMRVMPWERDAVSAEEMRLENFIYLEKRVPDSVLEVIPVREPDAEGLLYITRTRVIGRNAPRTVKVSLKRMFLCENGENLLPEWATFINGIINTTTLRPNAARDKYLEDDNFISLRERLGRLIISHLEGLKATVENRQRLSEILAFHDFGIKAACHYYEPFFAAFGHLLEWRVNPGSPFVKGRENARGVVASGRPGAWMTLPELLELAPLSPDGGPKRLSCFTSRAAATQYFEMADAANSTVIDASGLFEEELLNAWSKQNERMVSTIHVDRHDDPDVFREVDPALDRAVIELANFMSATIMVGDSRLHVEPRRFSPSNVTSVLRGGERSDGILKAQSILADPNSPGELKKMAEELLTMERRADQRMFINADNDLVKSLATLVQADPHNDDALEISMGLYNSAILANSQFMVASNAAIFARQYDRLMQRVMKMTSTIKSVEQERLELARARVAAQPKAASHRRHIQGFHITPFASAFDRVRVTLRELMEIEFQCELLSADQRKLNPWINENVRAHIVQADFFIVDLTDLESLNVLIETGAIGYGRPEAPAFYISAVEKLGQKPALPADLGGLIVIPYVRSASEADWRQELKVQFETDPTFNALLQREGREKFLSASLLHQLSRQAIPDAEARVKLAREFPTASSWRESDSSRVGEILRPYKLDDMAEIIRNRVLAEIAG